MSSYENKNEYEILDASQNNSNMSNRYPRYPLANDPQMPMRNTNYKEWLNMCDLNTPFVGDISTYSSPEIALSAQNAVLTGINVAGNILSYFGVPLVKQSFGIVSKLISILWRAFNPVDPWAELMVLVEELINRKIDGIVRKGALDSLDGLKEIMDLYRTRLNTWSNNKTDLNRRAVLAQYEIVDSFFVYDMVKFRSPGYEILLLPVYAQAANLHLILLRDADIFGEEWGLGPDVIRDNYSRLQRLIRDYKDHCVTFYNAGLNQFNRSSAQDWVSFNKFRRDMTLTVLDIASLFPNYDPRRYSLAVKTELTREIYTDPVGFINRVGGGSNHPWYNPNNTTFATMENNAIRRPSYSTWLNRIRVFSRRIRSPIGSVWGGHQLVENGNNGSEITHSFGDTSTSIEPVQDISFANVSVFSIDSLAHVEVMGNVGNRYIDSMYGVSRVTFHTSNGTNVPGSLSYEVPNSIAYESQTILSELPGENEQRPSVRDFSHRLSYISNFDAHRSGPFSLGRVYLLTYGWTHISMDRHNRLEPDKITQIDAVKGWGGTSDSVIPGPTGGNLVRMFDSLFPYFIRVQAPQTQTNYRIRLRYACLSGGWGKASVSHSNDTHYVEFPCDNASGGSSSTLLESNFRYIDLPGIFTPSINPEIRIKSSDVPLVMDKFEFIPLGTFTNQSLEKKEKAVNDLFLN
ncbi:insecticidal delta-endotoxin Cry8Ea1 family protein [Bacillus cereus]|uniref:insecticidal delta-endotoxin Cry8Ea1 family protein n=1 Tax=Bacillus cereus TaxID=1396 RepID=UPI003012D60F